MRILLSQGFGLNTDLYETNILNLTVVIIVVVKVVGDALQTLLTQRRQLILSMLQEADKKAIEAKERLETAQRDLENARLRSEEIQGQVVKTIERDNLIIQKQLKNDLTRFQERGRQAIELERQRVQKSVSTQISRLALSSAENILLKTFRRQGTSNSKQIELNEAYIQETFCRLKRLNFSKKFLKIFLFNYYNYLSLKYGKNSSRRD
jgi:F-type H+-transporting ATPase subunit b